MTDRRLALDGVVELPATEQLREHLGASWPAIAAAHGRTREERERLAVLLGDVVPPDAGLVVFGSLARDEVTRKSDVDWTLLIDGSADPEHLDAALEIERRLTAAGLQKPGREGTFGGLTIGHDLIHKIGGSDDTNRNTTQRILLLLESAVIGDTAAYDRVVRNVLRRYVEEDAVAGGGDSPFKVPRFLQNDIARYWRTVAVDFAYKRRLRAGSGWALRTVKLRMSRKLTYVAGLLSCFRCALDFDPSPEERGVGAVARVVGHLSGVVEPPPLDIVASVVFRFPMLDDAARDLFASYDTFLEMLNDPEQRDHLDGLPPDAAHDDTVYQRARQVGETFQTALTSIFFDSHETPLPRLTRKYGVF